MEILKLILLIGLPMGAAQGIYRLIDRDGSKTRRLSQRFPALPAKKFLIQIALPLLFMIVFGIVSVLLGIPIEVFFVVSGVFIGIINGMAVTMMYMD
ncbi:MAG: hypothetical protein IJ806_05645 [Ruminococcus sp.]|nr:hypothetical protein [Ruminococcus sp.]